MSLFVTITVLTFLNAYSSRLISLLLKLFPQDAQIKSKGKEIAALEKQLSTISMVHEFAKHFKLQRKITKLKDERKEIAKNQALKKMKVRYALVTALYIIIVGSMVTIVWCYRSESVAQFREDLLWPLSWFCSWTNNSPGGISVPCWIAISSSASKAFARIF